MRTIGLVGLVLCLLVVGGCGTITTNGHHAGFVSAVEKNGFFWETGRVHFKTDPSSSQEDSYCVENEEVFKQLNDASQSKQRVDLNYHSELVVAPWRCEEGTIIDSVTVLK